MEERYGFIHEKLDIKILILYILRRLPTFIDNETLAELCQCDGGVGYFDYAECLYELVETGNVEQDGNNYRITEKGSRNVDTVDSSLPKSVRRRAQEALRPVASRLERQSLIEAFHYRTDNGTTVELAMSDGRGEIIRLKLLAGSEDFAETVEKNFRENAEDYLMKIVAMMSEDRKEDEKK